MHSSDDKSVRWLNSALRITTCVAALCVLLAGGIWLLLRVPGDSYSGELPEATESQEQLGDRLRGHVDTLASRFPERNYSNPTHYRGAEAYLTQKLVESGYRVTYEQVPRTRGARNIVAEIPGRTVPEQIIIVGAHYDTAIGTPGADDNASGVSAVLEIADALADSEPERTIRFVLFVNEEPPWFQSDSMGSHVHARGARDRGETIVVMFSLEMLGYYSSSPKSQTYPSGLGFFYPDTGDFVAFVTSLPYRSQLHQTVALFRDSTRFPSEALTAPKQIQGIDYSDHAQFWEEGYPAVMVTDTAFMRNPNYHEPSDTPGTLDYDRFARVVGGLKTVVSSWASPSLATSK